MANAPQPSDNIVSAMNQLSGTCPPGRHGVAFVGVMRVDENGTWIKNAPLAAGDMPPIFHLMVGIINRDDAPLVVRHVRGIPVHCLLADDVNHTVLERLF